MHGIDFWAFPIVQVALLLILMSDFLVVDHHPNSPVDLARMQHSKPLPDAAREDALTVAVTRDGNVFFLNYQVRVGDLGTEIHKKLRAGAEPKVYIKADARAKYGDVAAVVSAVRAAKIQNITFVTQ